MGEKLKPRSEDQFNRESRARRRKSVTLSTKPCGSPFSMIYGDEILSYIFTLIVLFVKKFFVKLRRLPSIFHVKSVSITLFSRQCCMVL